MSRARYGWWRKLENGAVSKLFEFGHCRRRALKKCLCSGDCQITDCQPIARSTCTTVGFWKATGVQCRSGNRPSEALQGRFMIFQRTGYFQRRFSGGSRRDRLLAITPNVDYAAGWTFGVTAYDLSHQGHLKISGANPCIYIVVSCL